MTLKELRKKIQPTEAVPDNTRNDAFQVFGEKSVEGNKIQENALSMLKDRGLTEEDILDLVMGVSGAPSGAGVLKSLKGISGGLKGLAGKIGSKMKFPKGYGAPQSPGKAPETPSFIKKHLNKVEPDPFKQEAIKQQEIRNALNQLMNPNTVIKEEGIKKGMRQFGKFNRQLNK
jgi:hypothetical protein